jgi:hypothetical protein
MPASGGQIMQVPPQFARHIDPNNPVQMLLLQRIDRLTDQDAAAINLIPPPAVAVLKKVIPEVAFLLDLIGAPDMPETPSGGAAQPSMPRPTTRLGNY